MPLIGFALLAAGCMDAFHVLAADRLIHSVSDATDFIPISWAISRTFNAVILCLGTGLLLWYPSLRRPPTWHELWPIGLLLGVIAWLTIYYSANAVLLPQTQFPEAWPTRPWDLVPLCAFLLAGLVLLPRLGRIEDSAFTQALGLSIVPQIAVQLHMLFGSSEIFDAHFNAAHFLKIVAYAMPLAGMIYLYQQALRAEREATLREEAAWRAISEANAELQRSNAELEQFAYVASHDLQEPLRMVASYTQLLAKRYQGRLDEDADEFIHFANDGANRMKALINDLLAYSRVGSKGSPFATVSMSKVYQEAKRSLLFALDESAARIDVGDLPLVEGDEGQLVQLLQNLLANAIKYRKDGVTPEITIDCRQEGDRYQFCVSDNGIGIESEYAERIFVIFQRLHGPGAYSGTGIGLALCKRIVQRHQGRIWVESKLGQGACFYFTLMPADERDE
jgi:signal transduction histidine kinase